MQMLQPRRNPRKSSRNAVTSRTTRKHNEQEEMSGQMALLRLREQLGVGDSGTSTQAGLTYQSESSTHDHGNLTKPYPTEYNMRKDAPANLGPGKSVAASKLSSSSSGGSTAASTAVVGDDTSATATATASTTTAPTVSSNGALDNHERRALNSRGPCETPARGSSYRCDALSLVDKRVMSLCTLKETSMNSIWIEKRVYKDWSKMIKKVKVDDEAREVETWKKFNRWLRRSGLSDKGRREALI